MENLDPTFVWSLVGILISGMLALLRRFFPKFDASGDIIKQASCLAFALLTVVAWPLLNGQAIPSFNTLLVQIIMAFTGALSTYAVARTFKRAKAVAPVVDIEGLVKSEVEAALVAKMNDAVAGDAVVEAPKVRKTPKVPKVPKTPNVSGRE